MKKVNKKRKYKDMSWEEQFDGFAMRRLRNSVLIDLLKSFFE